MARTVIRTFLGGCIDGYNRDLSGAAFRRHLEEYRTFDGKTELWQAAHDYLKGGRHHGDCEYRSDGACSIHLETYQARVRRLEQAIRKRAADIGERVA